jgi:hypothetical protein
MLMTAIRRLREKWRARRERIKRLNSARSGHASTSGYETPSSNGGPGYRGRL